MELSFFIASGLIGHCKRWRKRHRVVAVIGRNCLVSVSPVLDDVELVCRSWSRQREDAFSYSAAGLGHRSHGSSLAQRRDPAALMFCSRWIQEALLRECFKRRSMFPYNGMQNVIHSVHGRQLQQHRQQPPPRRQQPSWNLCLLQDECNAQHQLQLQSIVLAWPTL